MESKQIMKTPVSTEKAPKPVGPYSQAVKAGKYLFLSGQLPIDPKEGKIAASDIAAQTKQVMENVKAVLEAAGYGLGDVVSTNVYLSSMTLFDQFNAEYKKWFKEDFPARTTISCRIKTGALVEIAATAYKD